MLLKVTFWQDLNPSGYTWERESASQVTFNSHSLWFTDLCLLHVHDLSQAGRESEVLLGDAATLGTETFCRHGARRGLCRHGVFQTNHTCIEEAMEVEEVNCGVLVHGGDGRLPLQDSADGRCRVGDIIAGRLRSNANDGGTRGTHKAVVEEVKIQIDGSSGHYGENIGIIVKLKAASSARSTRAGEVVVTYACQLPDTVLLGRWASIGQSCCQLERGRGQQKV